MVFTSGMRSLLEEVDLVPAAGTGKTTAAPVLAVSSFTDGAGEHQSVTAAAVGLLRQSLAVLLAHHVRGVPVRPVRVRRAGALLVLAVGLRRPAHRVRQVRRR